MLINKLLFLVLFLFFTTANAFSQEANSNFYKTDSIFSFRSPKGYVPSLLYNFGRQATAPFHFNTKEWLVTGAATGFTFILVRNDGKIHDWAQDLKHNNSWVESASPVVTKFGATYGICTVLAFGAVSAILNDQKGVQTALLATQSMITSGVWIQIIKRLTGRERPNTNYTETPSYGGHWYGPQAFFDKSFSDTHPGSSFDSFASGHTALAFSVATVFASRYNKTPVVPIISYTAATLVGLSRLTENKHWSSDVFVGALIGYACGKQVVHHFNETHKTKDTSMSSKQRPKSEFSLIQNGSEVGLSFSW